MPLKTLVKAGKISNLSDARYCAGMGVDMLGFTAIAGRDSYIAPKLYQEIRGWVAGPRFVAEIYGISDAAALRGIVEEYAPDLFELSLEEFEKLGSLPLPAIVGLRDGELQMLETRNQQIAFWLIGENAATMLENFNPAMPVLVHVRSKESIQGVLSSNRMGGIAINGSAEIRPGFKSYDDIADILEWLEE